MPLVKCPECGENMSSFADVCVHCGCPNYLLIKKEGIQKLDTYGERREAFKLFRKAIEINPKGDEELYFLLMASEFDVEEIKALKTVYNILAKYKDSVTYHLALSSGNEKIVQAIDDFIDSGAAERRKKAEEDAKKAEQRRKEERIRRASDEAEREALSEAMDDLYD